MANLYDVDPLSWPIVGRVGVCRAGEASGALIFLHLATADRDPSIAFWQAFLRPPLIEGTDGELFVDNKSGAMQRFIREANVDWISEGSDGTFEDENMGLRRIFASNGSPVYCDFIEELDASNATRQARRETKEDR